eukprot:Nk52_evm2s2355 gene=Nk52_evmTU2s2355
MLLGSTWTGTPGESPPQKPMSLIAAEVRKHLRSMLEPLLDSITDYSYPKFREELFKLQVFTDFGDDSKAREVLASTWGDKILLHLSPDLRSLHDHMESAFFKSVALGSLSTMSPKDRQKIKRGTYVGPTSVCLRHQGVETTITDSMVGPMISRLLTDRRRALCKSSGNDKSRTLLKKGAYKLMVSHMEKHRFDATAFREHMVQAEERARRGTRDDEVENEEYEGEEDGEDLFADFDVEDNEDGPEDDDDKDDENGPEDDDDKDDENGPEDSDDEDNEYEDEEEEKSDEENDKSHENSARPKRLATKGKSYAAYNSSTTDFTASDYSPAEASSSGRAKTGHNAKIVQRSKSAKGMKSAIKRKVATDAARQLANKSKKKKTKKVSGPVKYGYRHDGAYKP